MCVCVCSFKTKRSEFSARIYLLLLLLYYCHYIIIVIVVAVIIKRYTSFIKKINGILWVLYDFVECIFAVCVKHE